VWLLVCPEYKLLNQFADGYEILYPRNRDTNIRALLKQISIRTQLHRKISRQINFDFYHFQLIYCDVFATCKDCWATDTSKRGTLRNNRRSGVSSVPCRACRTVPSRTEPVSMQQWGKHDPKLLGNEHQTSFGNSRGCVFCVVSAEAI
jgi:hypothetical protein